MSPRTIAHIIHPVVVDSSSDLCVAQPITFETMRIARESASGQVHVVHFYTKYADESPLIAEGFQETPDLNRSIADITAFRRKRKLALIKDILDRLYNSTDAEYLIYTNVDIALTPYFYKVVDQLIEQGYDALIINRRSISKAYTKVQDIPLMWAQVGKPHQGCDCFVFKRSVYPHYQLGTAFVGSGRIGLILAVNLYYHATRFKQLRDSHLTFHIGRDEVWQSADLRDERVHNDNEFKKLLAYYDVRHNPPDDPVLLGRMLKVYEFEPVSTAKRKIRRGWWRMWRMLGKCRSSARRIERVR